MHWKNVILAILVGYMVLDLSLKALAANSMGKAETTSVLEKLPKLIGKEGGLMAIALATLSGFLAYYLAKRHKDCYEARQLERIRKQQV